MPCDHTQSHHAVSSAKTKLISSSKARVWAKPAPTSTASGSKFERKGTAMGVLDREA